jgi:hypothetical protein
MGTHYASIGSSEVENQPNLNKASCLELIEHQLSKDLLGTSGEDNRHYRKLGVLTSSAAVSAGVSDNV